MKPLRIINIDSFKFDYLKKTSFLKEFAKSNLYGKLETTMSFRGIAMTFITGMSSEKHNVFTDFMYSPDTSPFKNISKLKSHKLISFMYNALAYLRGYTFFTNIPNIPTKHMKYFDVFTKRDFVEPNALPVPTLFDILRENNISFEYFNYPVHANNSKIKVDIFSKNNDESKYKTFLKQNGKRVYWFMLWDLDKVAHKYGTESKQTKDKIREIDEFCQEIVNKFPDSDFLFWSDHGMVNVKGLINISERIKGLDVIAFLDSSMARFWGKDINKLKDRLKGLRGRILSEKDKTDYRINFKDNRYGDVIFLADPGYLVSPNYFQASIPARAMHGYDPKDIDEMAFYAMSSGKGNKNAGMADMLPTILGLLKLPSIRCEGRSLL